MNTHKENDFSFSASGLSTEEALKRITTFGTNEFNKIKKYVIFWELVRSAFNPLVLILFLAALASAITHNLIDALIIITMVVLSAGLNILQLYRSKKVAEKLKDKIAPMVTVLRDGKEIEIERRLLVPGDIIILSAGNLIPADCRLIESDDLHIQEAVLTGESFPVEKEVKADAAKDDDSELIFLGTSVVSGWCKAVVLKTGIHTAFGKIVERLSERPAETEFERGMEKFGMLILKTVFFLVLFVLLINFMMGRDPFESLLFSIALAVGLTPEFLPMITTVTLSQGATEMSKKKVIVKHLSSIQNLGSMDILCCDKTGTLTSGVVSVIAALDPEGKESQRPMELCFLNSSFESGISNPMEAAILKTKDPGKNQYKKTDEIPFDFNRRRLSVILSKDQTFTMITKGAPENIVSVCTTYEASGERKPINGQFTETFEKILGEAGDKGQRLLAVAYKDVREPSGHQVSSESEMTFAGFLIFSDEILPEVSEAIRALDKDGVKIKLITGDNEHVARFVASQVGIPFQNIVTGKQIDEMSDEERSTAVEENSVFVRVSPNQKYQIIHALKARKHVVGFLGDGINDAPSLHSADVGISVAGAVDIAREASDIILQEKSLSVLHSGILAGRRSFGNVLKYLLMGTSSNFGNMFSMAGAALFLPFLPMLPIQILLNNFLYDLSQLAIPTDNIDQRLLKSPQRWNVSLIRTFMISIGPVSSIFDFITFFFLLHIFKFSKASFQTGWFLESLATQVLVLLIIRTIGPPWKNRPSLPLMVMMTFVVLTGVIIPYMRIGQMFGLESLPLSFFSFLLVTTCLYLLSVYFVKEAVMRKYFK